MLRQNDRGFDRRIQSLTSLRCTSFCPQLGDFQKSEISKKQKKHYGDGDDGDDGDDDWISCGLLLYRYFKFLKRSPQIPHFVGLVSLVRNQCKQPRFCSRETRPGQGFTKPAASPTYKGWESSVGTLNIHETFLWNKHQILEKSISWIFFQKLKLIMSLIMISSLSHVLFPTPSRVGTRSPWTLRSWDWHYHINDINTVKLKKKQPA